MNKTRRRRHRRALREARGRDRQNATWVCIGVNWDGPSKIEVLPGTVPQVGGPHPRLVHRDEITLETLQLAWEADSSTAPSREAWGEILLTAKRRKRSIKSLAQKAGWILVEGSDPKTRENWYRLRS